jgi:aspartyl-tRNA(Asn)/glutamyl-tRNA(Gln) amidotransferase subunit C
MSTLELATLELDDLDHVLKLARLSLSDNEKTLYLKTLQDVLGTMKLMDTLPLEGVVPSTRATHDDAHLREDIVVNDTDLQLSNNAPDWDEAFHGFIVPQIL